MKQKAFIPIPVTDVPERENENQAETIALPVIHESGFVGLAYYDYDAKDWVSLFFNTNITHWLKEPEIEIPTPEEQEAREREVWDAARKMKGRVAEDGIWEWTEYKYSKYEDYINSKL